MIIYVVWENNISEGTIFHRAFRKRENAELLTQEIEQELINEGLACEVFCDKVELED